MDMRLFGLQFSHEQCDSSRWVCDKMTMIYCVQLPHFQTHIFLAPNQSFQFNSVWCSTCLVWMEWTAQSLGVQNHLGVSFGWSFPLSHHHDHLWLTLSAEKKTNWGDVQMCGVGNRSQQVHFLLRKGKTPHTSLTEIAPAPSEPGDKLSMDEEAISLLQIKKQLSINEWCIKDVLVVITFRNSSVTFHIKYSVFIKKWEV